MKLSILKMETWYKVVFLNPNILSMLIINIIFFIFSLVALYLSIKIVKAWDFDKSNQKQYLLEKQSFLAGTIIKYIFFLKIPLFLFFIFTLNDLSNILNGAMCAAGVIDATTNGIGLFILKVANIYLFGFWLIIYYANLKFKDLPYTKLLYSYYIIIFIFLFFELVLEYVMYESIDLSELVACCGVLYSSASANMISVLLTLSFKIILPLFYGVFILNLIFYYLKKPLSFAIANILFLVIAIFSLITFFSTYIYELPTHHCPFCILQKEYSYIGYFMYVFLFFGTFFGVSTVLGDSLNTKKTIYFKISIISNLIYLMIVSYYPIAFYIKNNTFLT